MDDLEQEYDDICDELEYGIGYFYTEDEDMQNDPNVKRDIRRLEQRKVWLERKMCRLSHIQ